MLFAALLKNLNLSLHQSNCKNNFPVFTIRQKSFGPKKNVKSSLTNLIDNFLLNCAGAFCVWVKVLSNDFSTELT